MSYTKGPWAVMGAEDRRSGEWRSLEVAMEQMPHIRVCFMTSDGPNMENAQLIAAAPELLEVLEILSQEISDTLKCVNQYDPEWQFMRRCLDKSREVIAKARGAA